MTTAMQMAAQQLKEMAERLGFLASRIAATSFADSERAFVVYRTLDELVDRIEDNGAALEMALDGSREEIEDLAEAIRLDDEKRDRDETERHARALAAESKAAESYPLGSLDEDDPNVRDASDDDERPITEEDHRSFQGGFGFGADYDDHGVNEDRRPGATDFYAPGDVRRIPTGGGS